ncbi:E3 ubiquitin-protein ligase KCMF1-like [Drosophila obscura]|uniref:E3 ubiquitin-protein ligase KCMF1-like n=1 Tax=Drosophila obscura TaxID=7282 RepID=UPI001BB0E16C|nr:E3 ubiquitin-protein ligase KCMF1-like [Drosophila obscura]XP_022225929.2 E3 ubiquitin-protein ligase KCMF1-like [Drosophila obscura]
MPTHWAINCDGCNTGSISRYRYKCLRCADYDLCQACFEAKAVTLQHQSGHPMQCLLDDEAKMLHFAGEPMPVLSADSFTCPVCGAMGHSDVELAKHVDDEHRDDRSLVICPLCVAVPEAHPERLNIWKHVRARHLAAPSILRGSVLDNAVRHEREPSENGTEESDIEISWPPRHQHMIDPMSPNAPFNFVYSEVVGPRSSSPGPGPAPAPERQQVRFSIARERPAMPDGSDGNP